MKISVRDHGRHRAVGLTVMCGGLVTKEQLIFPPGPHEFRMILKSLPYPGRELNFRAYDATVPQPHGLPIAARAADQLDHMSAPPAISILSMQVERGPPHEGYKDALILAGHAASAALFPPEARVNAWYNVRVLTDLLKDAIARKLPFSMVRLGDGEGRLLGFPWLLSEAETANETLGYMFGHASLASLAEKFGSRGLAEGVATLQRLLRQAVGNADCIGIPSPVHFSRHFETADGPEKLVQQNGLLGMAGALIGGARYFAHLPTERIFDTYIFSGVQQRRLFKEFLQNLDFATIVSHTDTTAEIAEHFAIGRMAHIAIPSHQTFMTSGEIHFPDCYEAVIDRIVVPFPGAVFLVAAGYLGKIYCSTIKQRGGIAIDIGAVFDKWFAFGRAKESTVKALSQA